MALLRGKLLAGALFAGALFGVVQQAAQVAAPLGGGIEDEDHWAQTLVEHGKRIAEARSPAPRPLEAEAAPAVAEPPPAAALAPPPSPAGVTPVQVVEAHVAQALQDRRARESRAQEEALVAQLAAAMLLGMDPAAVVPLSEEETAAYLAASWYFDGIEPPVLPPSLTAEEQLALEAALTWLS